MKKRKQAARSRDKIADSGPSRAAAERLVLQLLSINGPSGRENAVADYIIGTLGEAGVSPDLFHFDHAYRRSPLGGEVGNLALKLPGTQRGARRLMMAHMDTVPLCQGAKPVRRREWVESADKSTALGADDRAGTAVLLTTALAILQGGLPHPPLTFFWTVQEEVGLQGAQHAGLGALGKPRLAFNFDGGSPEKLTVGATGGYRMQIEVTGIASHAGVAPEEGVSAITIASVAIANLHRDGWLGLVERDGKSGTSNMGVIQSGHATNVIAPLASLHAEARSHNSAFRKKIVRAIEKAFRDATAEVVNCRGQHGSVRFAGRLDYESFVLGRDDPSVLAAEEALRGIGAEPLRAICNGGLDANWLTARGIPTVTLGCGQRNQHTTDERLNLDEYYQACRVALRLATDGQQGR